MTEDLHILLRLVLATVLSGLVGWERESTGKAAGARTHMLIGLGAALFVALGDLLIARYSAHNPALRFDPVRMIEAVVTGISFLGAGTIFVSRGSERVKGLTTAASILVTAAIGIAVSIEHYTLAVGVTLLIVIVLRALGLFD